MTSRHEAEMREFNFKTYSDSESRLEITLAEAKALVEKLLGRQISFERNKVLVNNELFYIPHGWVGCLGFLVVAKTKTVRQLGSGISLPDQVWGFYKGASNANLGKDRLDDLVIETVKNKAKTLQALARFINKESLSEVQSKLDAPPCILERVDLYFSLRELHNAEKQGWCTFKVLSRNMPQSGS